MYQKGLKVITRHAWTGFTGGNSLNLSGVSVQYSVIVFKNYRLQEVIYLISSKIH